LAFIFLVLLFFINVLYLSYMCACQNGSYRLQLASAKFLELGVTQQGEGTSGGGGAVAPMPGVVDKLIVSPGDAVKAGDPVAVIIAMKMEVGQLDLVLLLDFYEYNFTL